ncbi:hypothetical protein ZIOFF_008102 [Zingiber officinale]|uniref:PAS domain-containing protein n=1 Tax=Zingiber officinale TaxID=94328 RepID=A0A8J5HRU6_ZINOF|nr:hypothetical protein ZIOFF_008102 [Zingiber officinale]
MYAKEAMGGSLEELVKRFHELEVSLMRLREQMQFALATEGGGREDQQLSDEVGMPNIPGQFVQGPFHSVLKHIGHALHIYRPHNGEIIFWNKSAENLYGWKDYEALGKSNHYLLTHDKNNNNAYPRKFMDQLNKGQSWSGQLTLKKKTGERFTAMVTKSPLYEDGSFFGVITVSSDAALLFSDEYSEMLRGFQHQVHGQLRECKRVQWSQQPQITSSVSNLVLIILLDKFGCVLYLEVY